jgi:hypothetical protein
MFDLPVLSASHWCFHPKWKNFLSQIIARTEHHDVVHVRTEFREDLSNAASAHHWDHQFLEGWLVDEQRGGGAVTEYSHALHWLASIFTSLGLEFPRLFERRRLVSAGARGPFTSSITMAGSSAHVEAEVVQTMSLESVPMRKTATVEFDSGESLTFDFANASLEQPSVDARRHLMLWLRAVSRQDASFLRVHQQADWVDETMRSNALR